MGLEQREQNNNINPKRTRNLFQVAALCTVLALSACSPKSQSYIFGSHIEMGSLPDDICKIEGKPQIISVSTESEGDINLVYTRNNGDIVTQHYGRDLGGHGTKYSKVGQFYWSGGICPGFEASTPLTPTITTRLLPTLQPTSSRS
jgi:hypothetical protein